MQMREALRRRSVGVLAAVFTVVLVVVCATLLGLWPRRGTWANVQGSGTNLAKKASGEKAVARPVTVESATAQPAITTTDIRGIGSLQADEFVLITTEIAGRIARISFRDGDPVAAGDSLLQLDDALARAEIADAQARFDLAQANNERATKLSRTGNVTEKAIDEASAAFQIAHSALELQKVRLSKHTITAPFAGRAGIRTVSPGAFVQAGTPIANLVKIDVLKIDFKLPELFLASVGIGQSVTLEVDAFPGRAFVAEISAIDPAIDINGRSLQLRARLPNAELLLRPGLFARVVVKGKQARDVVLVPEGAIVPRGGESFVFRIEAGKAVEAKVKLGDRRGADVEILEGILPNTRVVTAGQLKLRNGTAVEVIETAPAAPPQKQGG